MITSGQIAQLLYPGLNKVYGKSYDEYPEEWRQLFDDETSTRAYEEDVSMTGFGLASVMPEGQGVGYDTEQQGYTTRYSHLTWGLGFIITRNAYEDDLYDQQGSRKSKELAYSMRQSKEVNLANIYNRAFNSSYTGTGGKELLSTAHPRVSGGTFANKPSVDADLAEASIEQACIDIEKMTNDRGTRIALKPKRLIIPVDYRFIAKRILDSSMRSGTSDNDLNALNSLNVIPEVAVNHYLTDADAWFIRTTCPVGMRMFQRRAMEFTIDNDFDSENAKFKATERYSGGWTDPRALYGSAGG